jgi:O-antigen ligase
MSTHSTRQVPVAFGLVAIAVVCGWALAQHSKTTQLLPIVAAIPALLLIFAEIGLTALWLWAPLAVITYPAAGSDLHNLSFGRVWGVGLLALLLILPRPLASARASSRLLYALALLAAVLGVRTITTPGTQGAYAYGFRIWAESLLVPLILFAVVRRTVAVKAKSTEQILLALLIAGLLLAIAGLLEKLTGIQLNTVRFDDGIGTIRLAGPYDAPEPYGLALVLCLAATLCWLQMRPRTRSARLAVFVVVALCLTAIFFTFFRVAWLSAVIVIVTSLALRPQSFAKSVRKMAVAGLIIGLASVQLDKVSTVSSRVDNTQTVSTRFGAWQQGLEIFKKSPVFGVGANQYTVVASQLEYITVNNHTLLVPYPHSSFVLLLAEDGVIGCAAFLFVCWRVIGLLRTLKRRASTETDGVLVGTLIGVAIAYLAFSLTLEMLPFGPSNQIFAVLLGVGAGTLDRQAARAAVRRDHGVTPEAAQTSPASGAIAS